MRLPYPAGRPGCRPIWQKSRKRRGTGAPGARRAAFPNFGGDPETEFFLDSVAEDLITELGRAHWFSIVARNTSFNYKGNAADSKQIARELGVWVEGSLREAGSRSGSVASSSKRRAASFLGPTVSTVLSTILSICRTGSPKA